ncbi:hypothetical protein [uncultured Parolsenella sp.]|uniref:phage tail tube protein n=1 Tax=uncultured Parolsenella sp. TaxID=2083008 RepID=UPI0025F53FA7|nr:hypothetical protein [uncultured Parolsenella sp.]
MASEAMLDSSNAGIAKGRPGGYGIVAPDGTKPDSLKDVSKTLSELLATVSGAASLGLIDEDGVTFSTDISSDDKRDWAGNVIASPVTEYSESCQVNFIESRDSVLKTVYGDANVTTATGTTEVRHNVSFTQPHLFAFDSVISETKVKRTIIARGVITDRDDVTQNNSDLIGYKPTIKCLAYDGWDGDCMREYIYDSAATKAAADGGKAVKG